MPLVPAKCTNCGASLQIDNTQQAAICPYCHSAYVVEQAINNYNYNVIVKDESSIDAKVENATTFLKVFKEYEKARQILGPSPMSNPAITGDGGAWCRWTPGSLQW